MITFYPTVSRGEFGKYSTIKRALLPASSWAREEVAKYGRVRKNIPVPAIPPMMSEVAADCGGFVASKRWGGEYKYTREQYVEWLYGIGAQLESSALMDFWAALMDFCCENEITSGKPGIVRDRQRQTKEMAERLWVDYQNAPWVWVPTIQGWEVADYARHVEEMRPLIEAMSAHYGPDSAFRVGIGTLCARASAKMIREVVTMVAQALPGVPLHLWGVKLSVLQSPIHLPEQVTSVDSGAWNGMWGDGRELWKKSPYSQREWCFKVALPEYEAKIKAALSQPKQLAWEDVS